MASYLSALRGVGPWQLGGLLTATSLMMLASGTALAVDVPIVGLKFVVVDKTASTGKATMRFVTKDSAVAKGSGTDPTQIEATLDVLYGSVSGTFEMPQGGNWLANDGTLAKFVNKAAPTGGAVKASVIKPGLFAKVVAKGLGDVPLDILPPQYGVVSVAHAVTNGAETIRHCSYFTGCERKDIAAGAGVKLVCKGSNMISVGDATCNAVGPSPTAVEAITAGGFHTCALLDTGALRCWGAGTSIGYNNPADVDLGDDEPASAAGNVPVGDAVAQVAAGDAHTCALLGSGGLRCWGRGSEGQLGYGDGRTILAAGAGGDVDVGGTVVQIATGWQHTCALLDTGAVRCWGLADHYQLGYGNTMSLSAPGGNVDVGGTVVQVAAGVSHTCALLDTGTVRCWGRGEFGALGYGNTNDIGDDETPASAGDVDVGGAVVQVVAAGGRTCALLATGAVRCWGTGPQGELGYGDTNTIGDDETPASAGDVDVGGTVVQLATGAFHVCALLDTGGVRCWGHASRALGYGTIFFAIGDDETPASAGDVDVGGTVMQVTAGFDHTCALLDTGSVRCWGRDLEGQLGYGHPVGGLPVDAGDVPVF